MDLLPKLKSNPEVVRIKTKVGRVFYFQGTTAADTVSWFQDLSASSGVAVDPSDLASTSLEDTSGVASTTPEIKHYDAGNGAILERVPVAAAGETPSPQRSGPRSLDPITELGVSDEVVAAITALNSEVQTAWQAVLAAALRARGLEQMNLVERELAQAQAQADGAQISALTAEVAGLQREIDAMHSSDLWADGDVFREVTRALEQAESLREDALRSLSTVSQLFRQEGTGKSTFASKAPSDSESANAHVTDMTSTEPGSANVSSIEPGPANLAACPPDIPSEKQTSDNVATPTTTQPLPKSTALRPPPNKPPRDVLKGQVAHLVAAASASVVPPSHAGHLIEQALLTQPRPVLHPALENLQMVCDNALLQTLSLGSASKTAAFDRIYADLADCIKLTDQTLSHEREDIVCKLASARQESDALAIRLEDLERAVLEQRRATEQVTLRNTELEIRLHDSAVIGALSTPSESSSTGLPLDTRALAELRTELATLRSSHSVVLSDLEAARALASCARAEASRLQRLVEDRFAVLPYCEAATAQVDEKGT